MKFNTKYYFDTEKNINCSKTVKTQIVLANTDFEINNFLIGLKTRASGSYKKIPTFTIDLAGKIYKHYDPNYFSDFFNLNKMRENVISIALENVGALTKDQITSEYKDWRGFQYTNNVYAVDWRGNKYWAEYSIKQTNALLTLLDYLCIEYGINRNFIGDNVVTHKPEKYNGVINRANYSRDYHDLTPAMDFKLLTKKINITE